MRQGGGLRVLGPLGIMKGSGGRGCPTPTLCSTEVLVNTFSQRSDAALAAWLETTAYALGRILAYAIVAAMACYHAGYALGRIVHSLNDRLARASHAPVAAVTTAADAVLAAAGAVLAAAEPTPVPAPSPAMAALLAGGATVLGEAELDRECQAAPKPARKRAARTPSRRKPATARKALAGVA